LALPSNNCLCLLLLLLPLLLRLRLLLHSSHDSVHPPGYDFTVSTSSCESWHSDGQHIAAAAVVLLPVCAQQYQRTALYH
jgi:hypothetical protein